MDPLDFFRALYATAPDNTGVIELRGLKNAGGFFDREFTADPIVMDHFLRRFTAEAPIGAYFGVALRKPGSTRGTKQDVSVITALWADVDVEKMGWDMPRTVGMIKSHELRPSAMVHSGHGLHLYWVLDRPVVMSEHEHPEKMVEAIEDTMRQLATVFGGDNTSDITRVLRVPGTWNTKGKPLPVKVIMAEWTEYDLADLRDAAEATDQLLDKDEWLNREQMKAKIKADREAAGIVGAVDGILGGRKFVSLESMWAHTRYGGGSRGSAFIGLDEAILRATATLYARDGHKGDDWIVEQVMERVKLLKTEQAPHEVWNMETERREIADKLARFKARWEARAEQQTNGKRKRTRV